MGVLSAFCWVVAASGTLVEQFVLVFSWSVCVGDLSESRTVSAGVSCADEWHEATLGQYTSLCSGVEDLMGLLGRVVEVS